jgi:hypothetical protein
MKGRFLIMVNGVLTYYSDTDSIPMAFDNIIEFEPELPPPPHTEEEHQYIEAVQEVFDELLKREKK